MVDGLLQYVQSLTKWPLRFKALQKDGKILAVGTDMELAELQAFGESLVTVNEPDHSGLINPTSEEVMKHVSRICITHCKR
jgi:galactose-1-phosphate uridylyltransferase